MRGQSFDTRLLVVGVAVLTGLLVLVDMFVTQPALDELGLYLIRTAAVVAGFALLLGLVNVAAVHFRKVSRRQKGWMYSIVLLLGLVGTLLVGFLTGGPGSAGMKRIFDTVLFPLESTLFSLLGFFVFVAIFRAFQVKDFESGLFVVFVIVVLLGQVPVGALLWDQLPVIKDWIFDVPALAGMRGILLGVGLGTIATGLRILMGIDRPYVN